MWWSPKFMRILLLVLVVVAVLLVSGSSQTARATENTESLAVNSTASACTTPGFLVSAARGVASLLPFRVQLVPRHLPSLITRPSWLDQFSLFRAVKSELEAPKVRVTFVPAALNRTALAGDGLDALSLFATCVR